MGALPLTVIGFPLQYTIAIMFVRVTVFVQPYHVIGPKTTTDQRLLQTEPFLRIITVLPQMVARVFITLISSNFSPWPLNKTGIS